MSTMSASSNYYFPCYYNLLDNDILKDIYQPRAQIKEGQASSLFLTEVSTTAPASSVKKGALQSLR